MARSQANGKDTTPQVADMSEQIARIQAEIAVLTKQMEGVAVAKADALKDRAVDTAQAAKASAIDARDQVTAAATDLGTRAATAAREHPAATLGLAAGLGFIIGMMTARRG